MWVLSGQKPNFSIEWPRLLSFGITSKPEKNSVNVNETEIETVQSVEPINQMEDGKNLNESKMSFLKCSVEMDGYKILR